MFNREASLLAAIIESSDDAIVSKDLNGVIKSWNKGAERIFGYTAEEAVGKPVTILIPRERFDEEPAILKRIRNGKRVDHYETIRKRKDGTMIDVSLTVSPIKNDEGQIIGASKIARDITDRKHMDQEHRRLLESERVARIQAETANRLKDEFLATLSHELRNPLNVILGYAEVLLRSEEAKRSPFVKRASEVLKRNALAQSQLIRDLLDLSRLHMGKLSISRETVSLNQVVNNAIESVKTDANNNDVVIKVETPEEVVFVDADQLRMEQVIWNLLNNSIKFTPAGGKITVCLSTDGDEAVLSVEDTGQGIDKEFLPYVFEMFRQADAAFSRKHGGLGIGLALVQQLILLHNGSVEVTSEGPLKGTEVTIKIPLTQAPTISAEVKTVEDVGILNQMRILIVDDNLDTTEMLRRLLEMDGAVVKAAASGKEALEFAGKECFDVIISDISMPGMDGFELLRRLRALPEQQKVPVVAITGFGRSEDVQRAKSEGFFSHLTKPIDVNALLRTLKELPLEKATQPSSL